MASAPSVTTPVKSALRTLDVIEFVVAHAAGVVAQDVAQALGIPVSSLSYLLATLVERQYLTREGRRYLPGPGLERLRVSPAALPLADRVAPWSARSRPNSTKPPASWSASAGKWKPW
jgi:IclR family acetate operon transcriptional repressor